MGHEGGCEQGGGKCGWGGVVDRELEPTEVRGQVLCVGVEGVGVYWWCECWCVLVYSVCGRRAKMNCEVNKQRERH